jgi:hypothetical protein
MLTVGVGNDNCNRKPLAHEAMRRHSHRECGGVLTAADAARMMVESELGA